MDFYSVKPLFLVVQEPKRERLSNFDQTPPPRKQRIELVNTSRPRTSLRGI